MPFAINLGNQTVNVQTGYCTNVHAGRNLATVFANLTEHSLPVRDSLANYRSQVNLGPLTNLPGNTSNSSNASLDTTLGLGLWFSEVSVNEALIPSNLQKLQNFLSDNFLRPFTFNGFPQTDFHEAVVKHRVYLPTWFERSRLDYTLKLVELLDQLLPAGEMGSISTLPIGWGQPPLTTEQIDAVSAHWNELAQALHQLYERTGRTILIAVEPEPGCTFTDSQSYRKFYTEQFLPRLDSEQLRDIARRYITICHDVCHAAVMFENQASELTRFFEQGMRVGKVQVSSAVEVHWSALSHEQREHAWEQLKTFNEIRYLHQVHIQPAGDSSPEARTMLEDLPEAFERQSNAPETGTWRIHFHVPIFQPQIDTLNTTQCEIRKCLDLLLPKAGSTDFPSGHFEIETYAWTVLPEQLRAPKLSDGISSEMKWFEELLRTYDTPQASIGLPC